MRGSLRADERGSVGAERVAAWVVVALAVALAVAVVNGPVTAITTDAPDAAFEGSYDADANAVTLEHAGGDAIKTGPTDSLAVVVTDGDTASARTVTWVGDDGVGSFPVTSGDAIRIDDATVDADGDGDRFDADATVGFELDAGDTARVVWRGRPVGSPGEVNETLGTYTVGADS